MNPPPDPHPIHSIFLISCSNFVHMVPLTTSTSITLSPAQFVALLANGSLLPLLASAAAGARLAAILRHFWREAWIRVPRSPTVYTHTGAGSHRLNEGNSRGAKECGCSAVHPHIPQHSLSYASTLLIFHGPFFFYICSVIISSTALISGPPACSRFCSGKHCRSTTCPYCLSVCSAGGG